MIFFNRTYCKVNLNAAMLNCMAVLVFMSVSIVSSGQKTRTFHRGQMIENYHVLPSDTSIKHGTYRLHYKTHLIESGQYHKGKKVGVWIYFNLGNAFEFQYNYDLDSIVRIAGHERQSVLRFESPCLFLGSPLVPYVFLLNKVGYPLDAFEEGISGKVDLYLVISPDGEIVHRYVGSSDHRFLTSAVLKASREFPDEWRWIPERRQNRKVESTYKITIFFDLH
ncbi:energy transducer TonB [Natronoflexus pectinivorans]|nr:energy transducer TonB [Natronoflexus pectinivorans]